MRNIPDWVIPITILLAIPIFIALMVWIIPTPQHQESKEICVEWATGWEPGIGLKPTGGFGFGVMTLQSHCVKRAPNPRYNE